MKLVKSLLLGSAAGLVAIGGAQAADLPVKAKAPAVDYVRICTAFGTGFFFIPGTDTCLRVGGRARGEFQVNEVRDTRADITGFRGLGRLNLDARTATSFGTLRTFVRFEIARRTGVLRSGTFERTGQAEIGTGVDFVGRGQTAAVVDKAFIQFAGFTAGRASSFFDFYQNSLDFIGLTGSSQPSTTLFAYTATLGGGFTATISVEDPIERRQPVGFGTFNVGGTVVSIPSVSGPGGIGGGNAVGTTTTIGATATPGFLAFDPVTGTFINAGFDAVQREKMPDIVGALRLDQSWGSAQISAAVHEVNVAGLAATPGFRPDTEYGFAVQGGVQIKLPFIAPGDELWLQAAYSEGALSYVGSGLFGQAAAAFSVNNRFTVDSVDAVSTRFGDLRLTEGFSALAAFLHYWTPQFRQAIFGGYTRVEYDKILRTEFGPFGTGTSIGSLSLPSSFDPNFDSRVRDYEVIQVGTNLIYSPVKDLDIGVEVLYNRLELDGRTVDRNRLPAGANARFAVAPGFTVPGVTVPGGGGAIVRAKTVREDDQFIGRLRIQRDF